MRTATEDEIPATAKRLLSKAHDAGWTSWVTYADNPAGERPASSIAVRLHKGTERLVGVWEDGRFTTGLRQRPFGKIGARQIAALVEEL